MVALLGICVCWLPPGTTALATMTPTNESIVVFEGQLDGHRVSSVMLHTKAHTFHASLKDGRKVSIAFPTSRQKQLEGDIRAQGIAVKVAKVQSPSHKLRYIVGGIAVVVIILVAVGLLYARRRRIREDEEGPGVPVTSGYR